MPKRTVYTILIVLVLVGILITLILTQCNSNAKVTPTSTSTPELVATPLPITCDPINVSSGAGQTAITLPDDSQIYLAEYTEIEFTPAGYCPDLDQHQILLKQGQVAVNSMLPAGKWIVIKSSSGYVAQLGGTGVVTIDPVANTFGLDCTNGACNLGTAADKLTSLACGESAYLDVYGTFNGPFNVDPTTLPQFGEWLLPTCAPAQTSTPKPVTATPTLTRTPTVNAGATATAYCASFKEQFPLTPCPITTITRTPTPTKKP